MAYRNLVQQQVIHRVASQLNGLKICFGLVSCPLDVHCDPLILLTHCRYPMLENNFDPWQESLLRSRLLLPYQIGVDARLLAGFRC